MALNIFTILYFIIVLAGVVLGFYVLYLVIRALQIYIKKNS
ncbi:uncharacterized protein YneF (UPF0154 family) [Anaerocolumna cellulosilytica]|nr:uncharacterized protein YneF (UPF0154 family) [Anaerocolumna cellulosilytica]